MLAHTLLVEFQKGDKSSYSPYIDALPTLKELSSAAWLWNREEVQQMLPPSCSAAALSLAERVEADHKALMSVSGSDLFSLEEYRWAQAIVRTRAFPMDAEEVGGEEGEVIMALWPGIDSANHRHDALFHPIYDESTGCGVLLAEDELNPGSEGVWNYGRFKSNADLLINAGFVVDRKTDSCEHIFEGLNLSFLEATLLVNGETPVGIDEDEPNPQAGQFTKGVSKTLIRFALENTVSDEQATAWLLSQCEEGLQLMEALLSLHVRVGDREKAALASNVVESHLLALRQLHAGVTVTGLRGMVGYM